MNYLFGEEMKPGCEFELLEKKINKAIDNMSHSTQIKIKMQTILYNNLHNIDTYTCNFISDRI